MSLLDSARDAAALVAVISAFALATTGCGDECDADDCEPCVGETCTATCVSPDDEDDAENCPYSCSDGANCSLSCGAVACHLTCDASSCECGGCESMSCTNGSGCHTEFVSFMSCDASTCESSNHYSATCSNGATCTLACDSSNDVGCRTACDGSSVCHVDCHGQCLLCCNGSADCTMDGCDPISCSDGSIVCGLDCNREPGELGCPSLSGGG